MPAGGRANLRCRCAWGHVERRVERVQAKVISVGRTPRRARTTVANAPEVVSPLARSRIQDRLVRDGGWNLRRLGRQIEEDPMDEGPAWRVRIFDDQGE